MAAEQKGGSARAPKINRDEVPAKVVPDPKAPLPWPCGIPGAGEAPGLMLGTAGIGYFYLRLAKPEIPTALRIGQSA
jgi:hypothetical protein